MGILNASGKPILPPHVQRMLEEADQLGQRLAALEDFFDNNPVFAKLDALDQHLLKVQSATMNAYLRVLTLRIERTQPKAN